jgi:hypothetical protein
MRLLGCKTGFRQVQTGKDKNGCPTFECRRAPCPPVPKCPPPHELVGEIMPIPGGCTIYYCERPLPPCPPVPRCAPKSQVKVYINPVGCPVIKCERPLAPCPPIPRCAPKSQVKAYINPVGCPIIKCSCPMMQCGPGTVRVEVTRRIGDECPIYKCVKFPHGDVFGSIKEPHGDNFDFGKGG